MRVLVCTQVVDERDPALGFFTEWISALAAQAERVSVVCLYEGVHALPENVAVYSLGKEHRQSRMRYIFLFYRYILSLQHEYDVVFVHMNQVYVLMGGLVWKVLRKRVALWYAHGSVSASLRVASWVADAIVTSTPEGFRLPSRKLHIVGQGIDTKQFTVCPSSSADTLRLLYIGRIAPIKRCEILIDACAHLRARGVDAIVTIVGDATHAGSYGKMLRARVDEQGLTEAVVFAGAVPHHALSSYLCNADIFINPSVTGSLDKAGLEALACGVPVITCNEAFRDIFGEYAEELMVPKDDAQALAEAIARLAHADTRHEIGRVCASRVRAQHSLDAFMSRVLSVYVADAATIQK